ncbi:PA4780 family RIO1-like protein kinase [Undibacterium fentianense]|uniref:non-specific serine/threonine protein kinase n=1 Tax=Undibacterium fentianense TaxID=2828728 RepID=A0A941E217_9BURK|nr:PA4780 family RIO1-like protein kinase [Undibacterium fentianense]MBR7800935.1 serine protein kinase RIO [Undibacterium fentianense]
MKTPKRLQPLIDEGMIDEVLSQLMSGKEATVYVVRCGEEIRCAKMYKEAGQRSFKQAAAYQEGRTVKNSRQARAMQKGSKYGRKMQEEVWQNAEVDALFKLAAAGVRVPTPYICFEGVLLMDLVCTEDGQVAPRLNDVQLSHAQALVYHEDLIQQVVLMLCAGIVHGDLSEFNILLNEQGPVIIDLPQAINAAGNLGAASMLYRDVNNLKHYFSQFAPELARTQYGKEIWSHYVAGRLHPDLALTGTVPEDKRPVNVSAVIEEITLARMEAEEEERRRMQNATN